MKNLFTLFCLTLFALLSQSSAQAASATYALILDGTQETGPADLDGAGLGVITLDDVTGDVSWDITYTDIAAPTGMHIHGPDAPAGSSKGIHISLGVNTSGGAGTLIDSITADLGKVSSVLATPSGFYVNIHNADFAPGAIRGQLGVLVPEPTSLALLTVALVGWLSRRSPTAAR